MDEAKAEYIQQWLRKSYTDLRSAERLAGPPDAILATAFYHCQQAAEKAVKGYLAFCDHPLEKTHNVKALVRLATRYEPRFSAWEEAAQRLTPYAVAFRHPPAATEPDAEQYQRAEQAAGGLFAFVCSLLPEEARPSEQSPKPKDDNPVV
jgi:HEPN domain-containing protein